MIDNNKNHHNTKEHILYAAKLEFAEKGYDGARMGSIAQKAKANQALIHYYFSNKENLYSEVLNRLLSFKLIERVKNYLLELDDSPVIKLYAFIHLAVHMNIDVVDPDFLRIVNREFSDEREHTRKIVKDYAVSSFNIIENVLDEGVNSGIFSSKNIWFVIMSINSFMMNYRNNKTILEGTKYHDRLYGKDYKRVEVLEFLVDHIFKSLSPENKLIKIPKISKNVMNSLDSLIEESKEELMWDIDDI